MQNSQLNSGRGSNENGSGFFGIDIHLDRYIDIKILLPGKVTDPDRKRRFVQEAKGASALNHLLAQGGRD